MSIVNHRPVAKGPSGETAEFELVTPEIATKYLERNIKNNRSLKRSKIEGYARDIRGGKWIVTGEALKFDVYGRLIDGQNRLHGIIVANEPAAMLVVRGVSEDALVVLDSGTARGAADMLTISGIADKAEAKDIAAIARMYHAYRQGDIKHAATSIGGSVSLTKSELAEAVLEIPDIEFAARYAKKMYSSLRLPVGAFGVAFLEFRKIDEAAAADFFGRIRDGVQLGPGDPFTTLSRRVTQDLQGANRRVVGGTALFYLFRTWNAWRDGETLSKFQIGSASSGWTPIPAPH